MNPPSSEVKPNLLPNKLETSAKVEVTSPAVVVQPEAPVAPAQPEASVAPAQPVSAPETAPMSAPGQEIDLGSSQTVNIAESSEEEIKHTKQIISLDPETTAELSRYTDKLYSDKV